MDDPALLDLATRLVAAAAARIMEIRTSGFTTTAKADQTPVTIADTQAEAIILAGLRAATPAIPIIAEEEAAAGRLPNPGAQFWLVDPLDGTREYAAGRAEFAVNIGLVRDGVAILGAVASPPFQHIHYGLIGYGAYKISNGITTRITARTPPPEGLTVYASRHYADDPALRACLAAHKIAALTNIGSALKFLRLAEGAADFYPRLGRTMEWDTAAPQAVLEAAGGCVLTAGGAPLRYGKPNFENPDFYAWGLSKT
ncbi:MAG: 3'(2'),5'-bisphosphate nucleotidase CysQ [Acidocella sp.]|nr:3'(2'),5'-bisphosphate nucleotidase CysQ [Acidocella sp.]